MKIMATEVCRRIQRHIADGGFIGRSWREYVVPEGATMAQLDAGYDMAEAMYAREGKSLRELSDRNYQYREAFKMLPVQGEIAAIEEYAAEIRSILMYALNQTVRAANRQLKDEGYSKFIFEELERLKEEAGILAASCRALQID